jgi:hypothetical protein
LAEVKEFLEGLGAGPIVIGAFAANEYRRSIRTTTDADLLARRVAGIREGLERRGYAVRGVSDVDADNPHLFVCERDGCRVDVLIADTEYQKEAMSRASKGVLAVEDVIVHKLIAWREPDRGDIRSILQASDKIDTDYIERWAREWAVFDRWQEIQAGGAGCG